MSIDFTKAEISFTQLVIVIAVQVPVESLFFGDNKIGNSSYNFNKSSLCGALASGLICQFPSHDRRFVNISTNEGFNIIFIHILGEITVSDWVGKD